MKRKPPLVAASRKRNGSLPDDHVFVSQAKPRERLPTVEIVLYRVLVISLDSMQAVHNRAHTYPRERLRCISDREVVGATL